MLVLSCTVVAIINLARALLFQVTPVADINRSRLEIIRYFICKLDRDLFVFNGINVTINRSVIQMTILWLQ